jgi:adenosylcobyric acid synthase
MAKVIMVQGTMSNAGKSILVAGLCRIFKQDGYRAAPFKSQNMALNSFITKEGLEMGRAQVMQAEAAGMQPSIDMNPILLKPTNDTGSQVIVNGKVIGNMPARAYFSYKKQLIPDILAAFRRLEEQADIIVIEGAGSPAEINLRENDIVNMGMAELVDASVLLVGDIDRGGVFAQLLGTVMLLEESEKRRIKGLVINKFRGDKTLLDPGIEMLEQRGGIPVCGVVPYMNLEIEDEDSLSSHLEQHREGVIDIAVIRFPRISNFTDFLVLEQMPGVGVRYVSSCAELRHPDLIILPGSKNTMGDLKWMRENGLEAAILKCTADTPVIGICGGYQMLGQSVSDPDCVEEGGTVRGMELLPVETLLTPEKTRTQVQGQFLAVEGIFSALSGQKIRGYEIHMGKTRSVVSAKKEKHLCAVTVVSSRDTSETSAADPQFDGMQNGEIYGTYIHGIFDEGNIARTLVRTLAKKKGVEVDALENFDYRAFRESQYDKLAEQLRDSLDMNAVYGMLQEASIESYG